MTPPYSSFQIYGLCKRMRRKKGKGKKKIDERIKSMSRSMLEKQNKR
jgi:hypothetical protein